MKKAKAIELLKLAVPIKALTQQEYSDFVEAVNMGMDALEQPTSPDTIDRKAALDALRRCQTYLYDARDPELKIELSSADAAIKELPTIQPEKAQLSQEGTTKGTASDLISRTETVKQLQGVLDVTVQITDYDGGYVDGVEVGISTVSTMPPAQPEVLTDKEQRIFLAAMGREEKVCRQVDDECGDCRDSDSLVRTCHEIARKVKGALWT